MSQRLFDRNPCVLERGNGAGEHADGTAGRAAETTGRPTQRSVPAVLWQPRSRTLLRQLERSWRSLKRNRR